jgi:hypothetical protein
MKYYINQNGDILDNNKNIIEQGDNIESWEKYVEYLKKGGTVYKIETPTTEPIKEEPPQDVLDFIETLKQKYNL